MEDINYEEIVKKLDKMTMEEVSRIKIMVSEDINSGEEIKEYHHGRCDVNSPWARGCSFDVLE